ncbi:MAG: 50S ribosomal protein L2 [Candidatus Thermoplasmatota archaeon]|nr:50S ribosomal protein L2 [Euryarchaeota archaeon]MBU4031943.1 50S ribosomal protein L2 [Candidatus Thermoplasmatota archaeon]MBU4072485.1 50S ribosomal protein L2 [Candidatus Thermoplasmatota archaeon]MBU4144183.1 50S ribosomal protein L2 [Candidatus Thermoplasmatota archaeon]MBU4592817.1 50S ribosomal protein L2 [Candidatus Thermoplasmatota archaeon]
MGKPIIPQRRGKGSMTYRSPSHRHKGVPGYPRNYTGPGKVIDIFHAPGRSTPMAKVAFGDTTILLLAPEGLRVNQTVNIGSGLPIEMGNIMPLRDIPEGTLVHNIEGVPGDGGKYVRTAGTSATIITRGNKIIVQMPSGSFKNFEGTCLATVGILANSGRDDKPFVKAGNKFYSCRSKAKRNKKVKGIAMNACNHPHGGGGHPHVGTQSTVSYNAPPGRKVGRLSPRPNKSKKSKRGV